MTNIITLSIDSNVIDSLDEIRKSSNITRSKLIRNILNYFCNDKELIEKVLKDND